MEGTGMNSWILSSQAFLACRIDGDLLLQMTEEQLRVDVEMANGLHRKRFVKCLTRLKQECDYSSVDHSKIEDWLLKAAQSPIMTQVSLRARFHRKSRLFEIR